LIFLVAIAGVFCAFASPRQEASRKGAAPPAGTYTQAKLDVTIADKATSLDGARVSADFFKTSKALPFLGRAFIDGDYKSATPSVAVLSYGLWQDRFEGSPTVIGTKLQVNGQAVTIVGVMPRTFAAPPGAMLWLPRID
jgi:putative ABC transport system permease protein